MNKVSEERMKLRIEYSRETDLIFSDNIPAYADWLENKLALRQPPVSGQLNCEHDWLVDMYDHFGFPASRFCDKCNTREAI